MTAKPSNTENPGDGYGKLTTHVLDTANGKPGAGIDVSLFRVSGSTREKLSATRTNNDGRCSAPLLGGQQFSAGTYELEFEVGAYFSKIKPVAAQRNNEARDKPPATPLFLDTVLIRFGINSPAEHYHVPLLVSPFAYSTYRGS